MCFTACNVLSGLIGLPWWCSWVWCRDKRTNKISTLCIDEHTQCSQEFKLDWRHLWLQKLQHHICYSSWQHLGFVYHWREETRQIKTLTTQQEKARKEIFIDYKTIIHSLQMLPSVRYITAFIHIKIHSNFCTFFNENKVIQEVNPWLYW